MIRHAFTQELHRGKARCPGTLVPSPTSDPFALRNLGGPRYHAIDGFRLGLDTDEVHAIERRSEIGQMNVRVDQSRNQRRTLQIDDLGLRTLSLLDFVSPAGLHDAI